MEKVQGTRCLELGAGATGLPGIVAAQLGCFSQVSSLLDSSRHKHLTFDAQLVPLACQVLYRALLYLQVVITDVDECLEALHENVSANLPSHCTLVPNCLLQSQTPAMQSAPEPCIEPEPCGRASSSDTSQPVQGSCVDAGASQPSESLSAQQLGDQQSSATAEHSTTVLVAELDWDRDASALSLPFDVVLIADVVSCSLPDCCCCICAFQAMLLKRTSWFLCQTRLEVCVYLQVYLPEAMQSLLECIHAVSGPSSTILLAYYKRFAPADEQFWKLIPRYFEFEKIPEATFGAKAQPDNLGIFRLTWKNLKQ